MLRSQKKTTHKVLDDMFGTQVRGGRQGRPAPTTVEAIEQANKDGWRRFRLQDGMLCVTRPGYVVVNLAVGQAVPQGAVTVASDYVPGEGHLRQVVMHRRAARRVPAMTALNETITVVPAATHTEVATTVEEETLVPALVTV